MSKMSIPAKAYIAFTATTGLMLVAYELTKWQSSGSWRYLCYFVTALLASRLRVKLPGIDGTMSVNFLFILLGILELTLPETLLMASAAALFQCLWNDRNGIKPVQILFNLGNIGTAVTLSYMCFHAWTNRMQHNEAIVLLVASLLYFVANT